MTQPEIVSRKILEFIQDCSSPAEKTEIGRISISLSVKQLHPVLRNELSQVWEEGLSLIPLSTTVEQGLLAETAFPDVTADFQRPEGASTTSIRHYEERPATE